MLLQASLFLCGNNVGKISPGLSRNSETDASEFLEHPEDMFPRVFTTSCHFCLTSLQALKKDIFLDGSCVFFGNTMKHCITLPIPKGLTYFILYSYLTI